MPIFENASNTNIDRSIFIEGDVHFYSPRNVPEHRPAHIPAHTFEQKLVLIEDNYSPSNAVFSHDGERIISVSSSNPAIMIWDMTKMSPVVGPILLTDDDQSSAAFVVLSHDGTRIALGPTSAFRVRSGLGETVVINKKITLWDLGEGNSLSSTSLEEDDGRFEYAAFSFDGKKLVTSSYDHIRVWDASTAQNTLGQGHMGSIFPIAFSPDGKNVVSAGAHDRLIGIWDAETAKMVFGPHAANKVNGIESDIKALAFSPDTTRLALGFEDPHILLMDVKTGNIILGPTHFKGHSGLITSLAFSPDGKWFASSSSDGTIRVWDTETGYLVSEPLQGHARPVDSVVFSPDGKKILSSSSHDIRVWTFQ